MILFTMLCIVLAGLLIFGIITVLSGGITFIATFGDVIICALLVYLIVKLFSKKKPKQ